MMDQIMNAKSILITLKEDLRHVQGFLGLHINHLISWQLELEPFSVSVKLCFTSWLEGGRVFLDPSWCPVLPGACNKVRNFLIICKDVDHFFVEFPPRNREAKIGLIWDPVANTLNLTSSLANIDNQPSLLTLVSQDARGLIDESEFIKVILFKDHFNDFLPLLVQYFFLLISFSESQSFFIVNFMSTASLL